MEKKRKVTVRLPRELLESAMKATGKGITETIRIGLELLVSEAACKRRRVFKKATKEEYLLESLQ